MNEVFQTGLLGLGTGAIFSLLALGIIVTFRGSGVLNLAHGAYAMLGAFIFNDFRADSGWGIWPALFVTVAFVALIGALTDYLVMRRLRNASALARLIATLGVLVIIQTIGGIRWGATLDIAAPVLPTDQVDLLGVNITADRLYIVGIAVALTAIFTYAWNRTTLGWVASAVAENERSAAAVGRSPQVVSTITWALGAGLAGLAGILVAPITQLSVPAITLLVVPALAAALLGRFKSFPMMLAGGLTIGVLQAEAGSYIKTTGAAETVPFLAIIVILVVTGSSLPLRGHVFDRLPRVGSGRWDNRWLIPFAVALLLCIFVTSANWLSAFTSTFSISIILLSLVVLIGYAGQVSLAQYALAGIGALVTARLVAAQDWPFELAIIAAVAVSSAVGALFALPALRTRGVNLAVVTLGLGVAVQALVFNNVDYTGGLGGTTVGSVSFLGLDLDPNDHRNRYAIFTLALLLLTAVAVLNIRRGRTGRRLLAMRSNERAAAASGVHILSAKLQAFAIAGAMAGLGGVAIGFQSTTVTFDTFTPFASITAVAQVVIGGVGFIFGAVAGAFTAANSVLLLVGLEWPGADEYLPLVGGIGVILTLIDAPDGLVSRLNALAKRWKRPAEARSVDIGDATPTKVSPSTLTIKDLTVRYGGVVAVRDLSLEVRPGEVVGLIGPNGAGKTSLMDAITGFTGSGGDILMDDRSVASLSPYQLARAGLSRSFQAMELFGDMTVEENLLVPGEAGAKWSTLTDLVHPGKPQLTAAAKSAVHDFGLADVLGERCDDLPYGVRRLVAIARAVAAEPSVLLLDEPVAGLDESESAEFALLVRRLADEWGMAVLVIEHDMAFVMQISDRVVVMDFGKKIAEGPPAAIREDPAALAAYLGEDVEEEEVETEGAKA